MRADLRLGDLKNRERSVSRLMNVKVPIDVSEAIRKVALDLGVSKTDAVVALLNEGLAASQSALQQGRPSKAVGALSQSVCSVKGCRSRRVAKGYCAAHYQMARRGRL
jgi:hypothetical protein